MFADLVDSCNAALLAAFGDGQTFSLDHGSLGLTIEGIFDEPGQVVNQLTGQVETTAPQLTVLTSDVAAKEIIHGTILTHPVSGTDYKIIGINPDGAGLTVLTLTSDSWE